MVCKSQIQLKSGLYVPCGVCPVCLSNQRNEWVFRLESEFLASAFGLFVTLTYDEEHYPTHGVCKRDIQLFLKRLRKHFPSKSLRYYLVSEYGDRTHRGHYHGLFFHQENVQDKRRIYDIYEQSWQNGFVGFGDITISSIVYCTKYCLKKKHVPEGMNSNFRLCSKMSGGIGIDYVLNNMRLHKDKFDYTSVYRNGRRTRMPRYYKTKLMQALSFEEAIDYYDLAEINMQEDRDKVLLQNEKSLKEFRRSNPDLTYREAVDAFNSAKYLAADRQNELIEKHVQKQKL